MLSSRKASIITMKIQLIRNATLRLTYAGHTFGIDPFLAPKHSLGSYAARSPNPLVDLPCPPEAVIADLAMVLVSHLHTDHFDPLAQQLLPDHTPIFCQPNDTDHICKMGFVDVSPVANEINWKGITIRRTPGSHGSSEAVLRDMGSVSGFILRATGEPIVYWAGDTILYEDIVAVIDQENPNVIITHSGGAVWGDDELIIMDAAQTVAVCQQASTSTVVATHLEALDHCMTSRAELRATAQEAGIPDQRLRIPADGEVITVG